MNKGELLDLEERAWVPVHAAIEAISEDRWDTPVASGGWSVKDIAAHIACWHAEGARQLECIRAGQPVAWPEVESFNTEAQERCAAMTVHETRAMSGAARHRFREEIAAAAPVALSGKLIAHLRGCGDEHYAEHLDDLQALVSGAAS